MKLSELKEGDRAEVTSVGAEAPVRRRLMDMGLIRGTELEVLRFAPLGDPIEIGYKGLLLTMRLKEAEGITVKKLPVLENQEPAGGTLSRILNFRRG
ncbi:MAG: ferrous iron transport protein A [Chlorobiaceae bacterium]|nr:ferrous iron transport protein A [Chlorobiaceae bacterium]